VGLAPRISAALALARPPDRGRILHARQGRLGWREALARCARAVASARVMSAPDDIAVMFDKRACHARLEAAGVPVPRALAGVRGWEDLRARMASSRRSRVFVKLAGGSSASGVVALETRRADVVARTTVELEGDRLYNSLRVRRYTDEAGVARIIDALCREGAHVEEWLPKAGLGGRSFDLRVFVLDGVARQVVVRASQGPITNLHLGNRRGDVDAVRARLGEPAWTAALAAAASALAPFPRTRHAGVDLLIGASFRRHAVLEVNAFGDLLPNAFHAGQDTYGLTVAAATGLAVAPAPVTSPLGPTAGVA
jgi:glutathione synthase/RimK-type ligase-like ATP-grasp enzyme